MPRSPAKLHKIRRTKMDEVDIASEYQDNAVNSAVEQSRRSQRLIDATARENFGRCLNCLDPLDHDEGRAPEAAKFCDTDCRDDHVKLTRSKAFRTG